MIRIHAVVTEFDANIVAQPFRVEYPQIPITGELAGPAVNQTTVERDAITRVHFPTDNTEALRIRIDVWKGFPIHA